MPTTYYICFRDKVGLCLSEGGAVMYFQMTNEARSKQLE